MPSLTAFESPVLMFYISWHLVGFKISSYVCTICPAFLLGTNHLTIWIERINIPQKRTKVKDSTPWINTEIRKNLRKLQRIYKQKKKTGDQNTKEKCNQLKHHTQKITRQQTWGQLLSNVIDYITITLQFS